MIHTPATIKAKELCLADFGVQKVSYFGGKIYDTAKGKHQTNIGYLRRGSCIFESSHTTIKCTAGDMIYIPEGTVYMSQSSGDPEVEYYCIHITFRVNKDGSSFDKSFGMQKISGLPNEAGEIIPKMYELLKNGDSISRISAIAEFYSLFAKITPLLQKPEIAVKSPQVLKAIAYIEEHFCNDYSTADIAKECFISESRLYHLFKEQLGTSPVEYKNKLRILRAIEYVKSGYISVEEMSVLLGFRSSAYFRKVFKDFTHMSPMEYRKKYSKL